jgi:hypothetical protein
MGAAPPHVLIIVDEPNKSSELFSVLRLSSMERMLSTFLT